MTDQQAQNQQEAGSSEAEVATPTPAPEPVAKDAKNGVTRPKAGTTTGRVWETADKMSEAAGEPAERKAIMEACVALGINKATVSTQLGNWRKYHGLTAPRAAATPAAPAAPAAASPAEVDEGGEASIEADVA